MGTIYTDQTISMSEFKKNPAQVLRTAGNKPVAVLNHNRPAFYTRNGWNNHAFRVLNFTPSAATATRSNCARWGTGSSTPLKTMFWSCWSSRSASERRWRPICKPLSGF